MTDMMERQEDRQLELFSQTKGFSSSKVVLPRSSFMRRLRNYEKGLLVTIGFITIAIISFSLGVEKGKRLVSSDTLLERAALPRNVEPEAAEPPGQKQEINEGKPDSQYSETGVLAKKQQDKPKTALIRKSSGQNDAKKGYTIQLASYKTKSYAQKEAEALKKNGLSPVVLTKGGYAVLCVGNFADRVAAESLLSELKKQKRYTGCLIRRL